MSDITSARLLGRVFKMILQEYERWGAGEKNRKIAHKIYMQEVPNGDFSAYQMDADDELVILGLAREMTPEEEEKEGVETGLIYAHEKGF